MQEHRSQSEAENEKEVSNNNGNSNDKEKKSDEKSEEATGTKADTSKTDKLVDFESKVKCDNSIDLFSNIRMKKPPEMSLATTFGEAKELFVPGLKHLMAALNFYVLDGFVTDHVKIAQDVSKLYKYLAFYEQDPGTKWYVFDFHSFCFLYFVFCVLVFCFFHILDHVAYPFFFFVFFVCYVTHIISKMHKRRINLLKEIEEQLAPHAYADIVQELCHELGVIHDEMASIKKEIFLNVTESGKIPPKFDIKGQQSKINNLYSKSIGYFTKFVQIYEYPPDRPMSIGSENEVNEKKDKNKLPKIDEECRHEYLEGHFMLAAMYVKHKFLCFFLCVCDSCCFFVAMPLVTPLILFCFVLFILFFIFVFVVFACIEHRYSRFIYTDKIKQIDAVRKSLNGYQHVVKFYDSVGGVAGFETQYSICKDMANLLPLKLQAMATPPSSE